MKADAREAAGIGRDPGAETLDGRQVRGRRNREAIVDALFALIGEGTLAPTAQQVAERAGVGLRSVFRHFSDRESLLASMGERLFARAAPILQGPAAAGGREARVKDLVVRRVEFFEQIAPYKRSADLRRPESPFLQSRHQALVRQLRADLLRRLPELAVAPAAVVDAIDVATSFEAWNRLRTDQRLSRERAHAALEAAVRALARALPRRTRTSPGRPRRPRGRLETPTSTREARGRAKASRGVGPRRALPDGARGRVPSLS
jgi:AcrR family transcriptional regulator